MKSFDKLKKAYQSIDKAATKAQINNVKKLINGFVADNQEE